MSMSLLRTALLLTLAALDAFPAPRFWGSLRPGPHQVGFRLVEGSSSPGSAGWEPRPIEIALWYPSNRVRNAPMRFGDYFQIAEDLRRRSAPEGVSKEDLERTLSAAITGDVSALTSESARSILQSPMFARRDAPAAPGRFPVVLWSARYGTVAAQAVLSEFLASRGFVIAAVRPKSAVERLPFEASTADGKLAELEAQSDDLRGALAVVRELPEADDERAALIAWSYAGESAFWLAQGDARIEAVLALDSNTTRNWVYQSKEVHAAAGEMPSRARFIALDRNTLELRELAHGNFNTIEGMIPGVMKIGRVQKWSKGGAIAQRGYELLARRVAEALDSTFAFPPNRPFRRVEIPVSDGSTVTADYYASADPSARCVALFHQSGSSRGEYRTIAPELVRRGYAAIAVDVRWGRRDRWNDVTNETAARHGIPEAVDRGDRERVTTIRQGEWRDLDAAIDWLRANGCNAPVIVWGASIQANGVFELAARRPDHVGAVVDVSPGEYKRDQPDRMKGIVSSINQPVLVLWGRGETDLSKPIFDALPAGAKEMFVSTGRHGNAIFFEDSRSWMALRDFLQRTGSQQPSR